MFVSKARLIASLSLSSLLLGANCPRDGVVGPDEDTAADAGPIPDAGSTADAGAGSDAGQIRDSGPPHHEVAIPARGVIVQDGSMPAFPFLAGTSETDLALTALWTAGLGYADTQPDAAELANRKRHAMAMIRRNLPQAQARLLQTLGGLAPDAAQEHLSLLPLLEAAGDEPMLLGRLLNLMMAPPVSPRADGEDSPDRMVRWVAATATFHHAQRGSMVAQQNILYAVQASDEYLSLIHI